MLLQKINEDNAAVIARIVRALIAQERFDTHADLVDALKSRLARLRIRWTHDEVEAAIARVESNSAVVSPADVARPLARPEQPPISKAGAKEKLDGLPEELRRMIRIRKIGAPGPRAATRVRFVSRGLWSEPFREAIEGNYTLDSLAYLR